jgi:hypothetical protein
MTLIAESATDLVLLVKTRRARGPEWEHHTERRSVGTEFEQRRCELRLFLRRGQYSTHPLGATVSTYLRTGSVPAEAFSERGTAGVCARTPADRDARINAGFAYCSISGDNKK